MTAEGRPGDPLERFQAALAAAKRGLGTHPLPGGQFLEADWPFLIFLFARPGAGLPAVYWLGLGLGSAACLVAGAVIGLGVRQCRAPLARRQTMAVLPAFCRPSPTARRPCKPRSATAELEAERKLQDLVEHREQTSARRTPMVPVPPGTDAAAPGTGPQATEQFHARRKELKETYHRDLKALDEKYPPLIDQREARSPRNRSS